METRHRKYNFALSAS